MTEKKRPSRTSAAESARRSDKADAKVTRGPEGIRRLEDLLRRILKVPKQLAAMLLASSSSSTASR